MSALGTPRVDEVTVFREMLHMHATGVRMTNEQIRNGEVIHTGIVDVYDFDQSGGVSPVQRPFTVQKGDTFRTTCYYRDNDEGGVEFGTASADEMCISYLAYYPRITVSAFGFTLPWLCGYDLGIPVCESSHEQTDLDAIEEVNRTFGDIGGQCPSKEIEDGQDGDDNDGGDSDGDSDFGLAESPQEEGFGLVDIDPTVPESVANEGDERSGVAAETPSDSTTADGDGGPVNTPYSPNSFTSASVPSVMRGCHRWLLLVLVSFCAGSVAMVPTFH